MCHDAPTVDYLRLNHWQAFQKFEGHNNLCANCHVPEDCSTCHEIPAGIFSAPETAVVAGISGYDVDVIVDMPEFAYPGETVNVGVTVINTGSLTLEFPSVYLFFPGLEEYRDYAVKDLGTLAPGDSKTVYFTINIKDSVEVGEYEIEITVEQCEEPGFCGPATWYESFFTTLGIIHPAQAEVEQLTPGMAELYIDSMPQNAEIYIDGIAYGLTPLQISVEEGYHEILIRRDGYEDYKEVLTVYAGEYIEIFVELQKKEEKREIVPEEPSECAIKLSSSPPGAAVYIEGEFKGKTPITVEKLSCGKYHVKIEMNGYEPWEDFVDLSETPRYDKTVTLTPSKKLEISGFEIDQKYLAIIPVVLGILGFLIKLFRG